MKRKLEDAAEEDRGRKRLKDEEDQVLRFQDSEEEEEEPVAERLVTPWYRPATRNIQDPMLRFHNEIIEFTNYLAPSEEEHELRASAFQSVKQILQERFGEEIKVEAYGSFRTKLYLPNADIDIVVTHEGPDEKHTYGRLYSILEGDGSQFSQVSYLRQAKVPIIKFVYNRTNQHFDVSVNRPEGLSQLKEVEQALELYPEMRYLIFVNKCMLKQRELSDTYTGGVGSYLLFCMVLCFLRESRKAKKNYTLGEYLLNYLEFYGIDNWTERRILVKKQQIVHRQPDNVHFSLMSPLNESQDIGAPALKIKDVFAVYRNRYRLLTNYNFKNGESIVKFLVNPSSQVFSFLKE